MKYIKTFYSVYLNFLYFKTSNSEMFVRCSSLLVGVLGCYCYLGVIAEEEAYKSELFQKAKVRRFISIVFWINLNEIHSWENWYICLENKLLYRLTVSFM